MSRVPGERAPVSAPSSASLLTPAARDARPRALEAITGATPGVRKLPAFYQHETRGAYFCASPFF